MTTYQYTPPEPSEQTCRTCKGTFVSSYGGMCEPCGADDLEKSRIGFLDASLQTATNTLPPWRWARFDDATFVTATERAPKIVEACRSWEPGDGCLVLSGPTGVGKTSSVVALAYKLRQAACVKGAPGELLRFVSRLHFTTAHALIADKKQHALGRGQPPEVNKAEYASVLFLDDLGCEPTDELMFALVNARYERDAATIVTTGKSLEELRARYGSALVRRWLDRGEFVDAK